MVAMRPKIAHDALAMIEYGDAPALYIFGDSEAALERGRRSAERAGCRIAGLAPIAGSAARLDARISADPVLVEADEDGEGLDALLDRLQANAASGRHRSVVIAPEALIDPVAARTPHPDVFHLCRPAEHDRIAALALATAPREARLHDVGRRDGPASLQQLSEEMGRLASILASMSEKEATTAAPGREGEEEGEAPIDAAFVRAIIRARRMRDQYFQGELFADPAWDMLLDLMAARLEKNRVAVSSLCIAAAVPATTALRWIKTLTDRGLLVRAADPQDGRRVYIELSDGAARALASYLRAAQRIAPVGI